MIISIQLLKRHGGQDYSQAQAGTYRSSGRRVVVLLLALFAMGMAGCSKNESATNYPVTSGEDSMTLTPDRMALAVVGQAYTSTIQVYANTPNCNRDNFDWWKAETLPPGLTWSNPQSDQLKISGTPTTAGTYSFDVTVHELNCMDTQHKEQRTIVVADSLDLTGTWEFVFIVADLNSDCTDDKVGDQSTETIYITQNSDNSLELDGFGYLHGFHIHGNLINWNGVLASGVYPEDSGGTKTEHNLTVYTKNDMSGYEAWSWEIAPGAGGCSGARSLVVATRIP